MKNKSTILNSVRIKRFKRRLRSKQKAKKRRSQKQQYEQIISKSKIKLLSDVELFAMYLPPNLKYLISDSSSLFSIDKLRKIKPNLHGTFVVPEDFSILDSPQESYRFIQEITASLIFRSNTIVTIDYSRCTKLELSTQVLLDIILKEAIEYYNIIKQVNIKYSKVKQINGTNFNNEDIKKLLFSVGSHAIHIQNKREYSDIISYELCVHDREKNSDPVKIIEQKDVDTTRLVDYVVACLKRINKKLTPEKIEDLCIVISEMLINAEEHSSTKYRYSIGYFHEKIENGKHYGVFRLTILNFGKTIYQKFIDPMCPNFEVVKKMKRLSENYLAKKYFFEKGFEEESLWTLYSLQEGVTSVAPEKYKKRGNGSIQFIESFFNFKDEDEHFQESSKMTILSGNTSIVFDGKYKIFEKHVNGETFKYMTFNKSKDIEEKPDNKYVKFVDDYFPGTLISTQILFNDKTYES